MMAPVTLSAIRIDVTTRENRRLRQVGFLLLSKRERQVLDLLLAGLTRPEITSALSVSRYTFDRHRRHVFRKLLARTDIELALVAVDLGIVPGLGRVKSEG